MICLHISSPWYLGEHRIAPEAACGNWPQHQLFGEEQQPTIIDNGYGDYVADLYA